LSCIGALVLVPLIIIIGAAMSGIIGAQLWNWFVVTTFHAPEIGIPTAIGLGMVASYFSGVSGLRKAEKNQKTADVIVEIIYGVLVALMTLGIGWIVFQFVPK